MQYFTAWVEDDKDTRKGTLFNYYYDTFTGKVNQIVFILKGIRTMYQIT